MTDNQERGRIAQHDGEIGQNIAQYELKRMGLEMIEPVYTPWKIVWSQKNGRRVPVKAFAVAKVSGDFRAITPTGQSVLVEVKSRKDREALRWSDLEPHQREALQQHSEHGGLSLVVWVTEMGECMVMAWPIPGFGFRKSISWDDAVDIQWTGV